MVRPKNVKLEKVLALPYSKCLELKHFNLNQTITLHVLKPLIIIFTDPRTKLNHRMGKTNLQEGIFHIRNERAETFYYNLKLIEVQKQSSKFSCSNYEYLNEYKDCIQETLQRNLLDLIGCIPPWLMVRGYHSPKLQCPGTLRITNISDARNARQKLEDYLFQIRKNSKIELESDKSCPLPCNELWIKSDLAFYLTGNWTGTYIHFTFETMARIEEHVNNYDKFSLAVEIGKIVSLN